MCESRASFLGTAGNACLLGCDCVGDAKGPFIRAAGVSDRPGRREHRPDQAPGRKQISWHLEQIGQSAQPRPDMLAWIVVPGIEEQRADVVTALTDQPMRIDGYPTAVLGTEEVAVMEVAMQHVPLGFDRKQAFEPTPRRGVAEGGSASVPGYERSAKYPSSTTKSQDRRGARRAYDRRDEP